MDSPTPHGVGYILSMRVGSSHAADGMTQNEFLSRLWPFKHELLEWAVNFFTPLFAYFFFPRIIYPVRWILTM